MKETDKEFLQNSFKKFYFEHSNLIRVPDRAPEREFGFQKFNSGMNRHISIKDDKELHLLLMQNIPSDVYCSNAYYSFPTSPMNEKDWKEADLIFDIDAKDLNLSCRGSHTISICNQCKKITQDFVHCSNCNSSKFEKKSLPCNNCMNSSKKEVSKLIEVLEEDFGVIKENIYVYFSGNEGFHVYVFNSEFQTLGSRERSDLADYIMFKGIIPETYGLWKFKSDKNLFPDFDQKGWRGRFSKEVFGSKSKRPKIVSQLIKNGYSSFQKTFDEVSEKIGVKIDPNVTMDIHRIFRLPGSINSKSGLAKILCKDLKEFDPYSQSCLINEDSVEVKANCPIQFKLKNKKFGPYNDEIITIPSYAAAYMICKNFATIS